MILDMDRDSAGASVEVQNNAFATTPQDERTLKLTGEGIRRRKLLLTGLTSQRSADWETDGSESREHQTFKKDDQFARAARQSLQHLLWDFQPR